MSLVSGQLSDTKTIVLGLASILRIADSRNTLRILESIGPNLKMCLFNKFCLPVEIQADILRRRMIRDLSYEQLLKMGFQISHIEDPKRRQLMVEVFTLSIWDDKLAFELYSRRISPNDLFAESISKNRKIFTFKLVGLIDPAFDGNYPILSSSGNGHNHTVRLLLKDPRVDPSTYGNKAIQLASENGHTEVVRLLLQDPRVNPSTRGNNAFQLASEKGHTEVVRLLLPRVDPSVDDNYAIRMASVKGHAEVVRLLLLRVDPSVDDNYAIQLASAGGHTEVVRLLLQDPRVDPSAKDNLAIRIASKKGYIDVVRLLLQDPRVDLSSISDDAIRLASLYGHIEVVTLLRQHKTGSI